MKTGGLTEIRVRSDNAFKAYAYFLKDFRKELFSRSINWSFPLDTFLSELDSLVKFYVNIFNLVESNCVRNEEKDVLADQLMNPLSLFFKSIDQEFGINYFEGRMETLKTESPTIVWKTESIEQKLDRMAEANRRRRNEIRKKKEEEIEAQIAEEEKLREKGKTTTINNKYGHRFVVPREVYSNAEYREYLDHAETMKSVKVIVDEYYRKHKQHWWNKS